jgi:hypothetical protein
MYLVAAARAADLRAGAAKVSITPSPDEFPYTVPKERSFVGVHDDVYARALILDDGTTRVGLVSIEVVEVPDAVRVVSEVSKAIGAPPSNVMVTATHTHGTPLVFYHGGEPNPIQSKEIQRIRESAVAAASKAAADLQPAGIGFARGEAWLNINNGELAEVNARYDPKGPSDKTLDVVRLENTRTGRPIALLVDYSTHAEVMFRSVTKNDGYEVTGDMPGAVSKILEDSPAGAPVTLFLAGDEGDQKPLFQAVQPAVGKLPAQDEGIGSWGLLDAQARRLATDVVNTLSKVQVSPPPVTIRTASSSVSCPGRADAGSGKPSSGEVPPVSISLSAFQAGDIAIVAIAGDVGSDIGKKIRSGSPTSHTVLVTMLAGSVGYILSDASYAHPGHVRESRLMPGCAEHALPEGVANLLKEHAR